MMEDLSMGMKEKVKRVKNLICNRIFPVNGTKRTMKYLGSETKTVEIWYDSKEVKSFIENMPYKDAVAHIFGSYQCFSGKKVRYILLVNEWENNDNWYYPNDKTWVITLKGAVETIIATLERQGKDIQLLRQYCIENGLLNEKDVKK